jgi:hypothetical protein
VAVTRFGPPWSFFASVDSQPARGNRGLEGIDLHPSVVLFFMEVTGCQQDALELV